MTEPNRRPKVLIADKIAEQGFEILAEHFDVDEHIGLAEDELSSIIADYEAIVVRSATRLPADVIAKATSLEVIARAGAGLDTIDVAAALEAGIEVINSPDANTLAVAELTLGYVLALARNLTRADASMKAGRWEKSALMGTGVAGKTLGIIGFGRIGRAVAERAAAFGMEILTNQHRPTPELYLEAGVKPVDLHELLDRSDFVTIHVPARVETEQLVDSDFLSRMRPSAWLINTSRGSVVDEPALLEALDNGTIRGAALDVFTEEPAVDSTLARHPKVIASPHIGASTSDAQTAAAVDVAEQLVRLLAGVEPRTILPLRVIATERLIPHEAHDDRRVTALAARMAHEHVLRNPPIVTPSDESFVLLDGATRAEALRRSGLDHLVVQVVDPADLRLDTWSHALRHTAFETVTSTVGAGDGLTLRTCPADDAVDSLIELGGVAALIDPDREQAAIVLAETGLNRFAAAETVTRAYGAIADVSRTLVRDLESAIDEFPDMAAFVVFPHFSVEQVLLAARSGRLLPAGVTRFIVPGRVLHLDIELDWLRSADSIEQKNRELHERLRARHLDGEIRYYSEPVYLLDE